MGEAILGVNGYYDGKRKNVKRQVLYLFRQMPLSAEIPVK